MLLKSDRMSASVRLRALGSPTVVALALLIPWVRPVAENLLAIGPSSGGLGVDRPVAAAIVDTRYP